MTLTITLPADMERSLKDHAKRKGMSLESYALEILKQDAPYPVDSTAFYSLPPEERVKDFLAWANSHDYITGIADDSRESIYEGCGE